MPRYAIKRAYTGALQKNSFHPVNDRLIMIVTLDLGAAVSISTKDAPRLIRHGDYLVMRSDTRRNIKCLLWGVTLVWGEVDNGL